MMTSSDLDQATRIPLETKLLFSLRGHSSGVTSTCVFRTPTQDGQVYLVSGDDQGFIFLWDWELRRPIVSWRAHSNGRGGVLHLKVLNLALEPSATRPFLFSQGRDDTIQVWDMSVLLSTLTANNQVPTPVRTLLTNSLHFCRFDTLVSVNGNPLFALPNQHHPHAFDVYDYYARMFLVTDIAKHNASKETGMVMCLRFIYKAAQDPVSQFIAAGYENGSVHVFNWKTSALLCSFKCHSEPVMSLSVGYHQETPFLATVAADNLVIKYILSPDFVNKENGGTASSKLQIQGASDLIMDTANNLIIVGCWNGSIRLVSLDSMTLLGQLVHHKKNVRRLTSLDGAFQGSQISVQHLVVVAASEDTRISVWSLLNSTKTMA